MEQNSKENIIKITIPILLVSKMHIAPTKLLGNYVVSGNYDLKENLYGKFQGLNWDDNKEIEKTVAVAEKNKDKKEDLPEKNKRLKKRRYTRNVYQKPKKKLA